jgi:hypothetical protein
MQKTALKLDYLNSLAPMTFMDDAAIKNNFVAMYRQMRSDNEEEAEAFHARESLYFKRRLMDSPDLRASTIFSLYACFIDIVANGLSFDPDSKLVYLETRNANVGTQQNVVWEKRAKLVISPYGELTIRMEVGQIKYIDQPVVVYDCDSIRIRTNEAGQKVVVYEGAIPRTSKKIIACFVKVTRPDGSFDFNYLLEDDIIRLAAYSQRNNSRGSSAGKANALYTSNDGQVDPGFLIAKTIKHAFRTFPKVRIKGTNTELDNTGDYMPSTELESPVAPAAPAADLPADIPADKQNTRLEERVAVAMAGQTFGAEAGPVANTTRFDDETF